VVDLGSPSSLSVVFVVQQKLCDIKPRDHCILQDLHLLSVCYGVQYKLCTLTDTVHNGVLPGISLLFCTLQFLCEFAPNITGYTRFKAFTVSLSVSRHFILLILLLHKCEDLSDASRLKRYGGTLHSQRKSVTAPERLCSC